LLKTTSTISANSSGQIILNLSSLPASITDTGIKIGDYALTPTPPAPLPGDVNSDGVIDFADLKLLISQFNQSNTGFNLVGLNDFIDIFDYNRLITIW
jgi:hypothetical protein